MITADPYIPVPPVGYGGIERVIDMLVRGLAARGHEIDLIAHPGSVTTAKLHPYGIPPHRSKTARMGELWQVGSLLLRLARSADLVHSFGRLAALTPILSIRSLPKIQSYQREAIPWRSVAIARRVASTSIRFTGCSRSIFEAHADREKHGEWSAIFNGVPASLYTPTSEVAMDAPLVFLGRIEPIKGAHHAIAIARQSGRRLLLAGNRVASADAYFEKEIAPHLGAHVEYVGEVNDAQKNSILGQAAAFLMPIEWNEPFGIVMAEAMACGTPVIGFARGSVPEVVRDGVNGFVCTDVRGAVDAVARIGEIDRRAVRRDFEERFSDRAIVDAYESLYLQMRRR